MSRLYRYYKIKKKRGNSMGITCKSIGKMGSIMAKLNNELAKEKAAAKKDTKKDEKKENK